MNMKFSNLSSDKIKLFDVIKNFLIDNELEVDDDSIYEKVLEVLTFEKDIITVAITEADSVECKVDITLKDGKYSFQWWKGKELIKKQNVKYLSDIKKKLKLMSFEELVEEFFDDTVEECL